MRLFLSVIVLRPDEYVLTLKAERLQNSPQSV